MWGIDVVHRRARLPEDAGIGLLFVGMLALGVIVMSRQDSYAGDLTSYLFGDILGIDDSDLVPARSSSPSASAWSPPPHEPSSSDRRNPAVAAHSFQVKRSAAEVAAALDVALRHPASRSRERAAPTMHGHRAAAAIPAADRLT